MSSKLFSFAALFAILAPFALVGCAADASSDDTVASAQEDATRAPIAAGNFKMYGMPNVVPDEFCDRYVNLELSASPAKATLTSSLAGSCEIYVLPDERSYDLREVEGSCGSRKFVGSYLDADGKLNSITILDHRTRICEDIVPASIVVEETRPWFGEELETFSLYSTPFAEPSPGPSEAVTITGELVSTVGIGGENTGTSILTDDGRIIELVLDPDERRQFRDGQTARVIGTTTTLSGVETSGRPAIDVADFLVCPDPGWVNCMPGWGAPSPYCSPDARAWVEESCVGVQFAD